MKELLELITEAQGLEDYNTEGFTEGEKAVGIADV